MTLSHWRTFFFAALFSAGSIGVAIAQDDGPDLGAPQSIPAADAAADIPALEATEAESGDAAQAGFEELTRGPVHEAFAEPISSDLRDGLTVDREPPEPIRELPPEVKPEGDEVVWIPGYWGWEDERNDFVWVSGLWRIPPPGQYWTPGYWTEEGGKYRWVSGFWNTSEVEQITYLPAPPATLEEGPSSPSPGDNYFWAPGNWAYQNNDYAWSPGYWAPVQQNWVWMAPHYCWTPRGYVYIPGYYDYTVPRRGVLFAPVYYSRPLYTASGYYYTPNIAINTVQLAQWLFVRPNYGQYYFGAYYGPRYANLGYVPWYSYGRRPSVYDPFYSYYNSYYSRNNRNWYRDYDNLYSRRGRDDFRMPGTYREYRDFARRGGPGSKDIVLARSVNQVINDRDFSRLRMEEIDRNRRDSYRDRSNQLRDFQRERRDVERGDLARRDGGGRGPGRDGRPGDRDGRPGDGRTGDERRGDGRPGDRDGRGEVSLRVPDDLRRTAAATRQSANVPRSITRDATRDIERARDISRGRDGQPGDRGRDGQLGDRTRDGQPGGRDRRPDFARDSLDGRSRDAIDGRTRDSRSVDPRGVDPRSLDQRTRDALGGNDGRRGGDRGADATRDSMTRDSLNRDRARSNAGALERLERDLQRDPAHIR